MTRRNLATAAGITVLGVSFAIWLAADWIIGATLLATIGRRNPNEWNFR